MAEFRFSKVLTSESERESAIKATCETTALPPCAGEQADGKLVERLHVVTKVELPASDRDGAALDSVQKRDESYVL